MGKIIFRHWILNNQWISLTSLIIFAAILSSPGIIMAGSYFSRNGHYYERILIPPNTTWHQCRDSAVALGGYLAIATSEDENNFLAHLAAPYMTFLGGTDEANPNAFGDMV